MRACKTSIYLIHMKPDHGAIDDHQKVSFSVLQVAVMQNPEKRREDTCKYM